MPKMENRRRYVRQPRSYISYIRKKTADGRDVLFQMNTGDISEGGIFLISSNLSILSINDKIDIFMDNGRDRFCEGRAIVVRSARIFSDSGSEKSGFGVKLINRSEQFPNLVYTN